jgi:thiol-disulfide isomerase/thioredoxin
MKKILAVLYSLIFIYLANAAELVETSPKVLPMKSLVDINGGDFNLGQLEDNVLIVHFWATWCSSCAAEMEQLNSLQKLIKKDKIIVLPISEDFKGDKVVKDFYQNYGLTSLASFIDRNQRMFHEFGIVNLPATLVVDSLGQVVAIANGPVDWLLERNIALLRKYVAKKVEENPAYVKLINSQKSLNKDQSLQSKNIDSIIPKSAQTELEVTKDSQIEFGEIRVSNISGDEFSLKVRRPVNF